MKLQTTKKAVRNSFSKIIRIGYCDAQYLLNYKKPFAYSAGTYGWACDYYDIDGICISTGYSPIGSSIKYEKLIALELLAAKVANNTSLSYSEKVSECDKLIEELLSYTN